MAVTLPCAGSQFSVKEGNMSGTCGYVGYRRACYVLLRILERLEYRGYDSAGIAVIQNGGIEILRVKGRPKNLARPLERRTPFGCIGIGHTRYATHGEPSVRNAHPHVDCIGEVVVVHNGIVYNCYNLRQQLRAEGHRFASETDTEVIAHLLERYLNRSADLVMATRLALRQIKGAHAIVAMSNREPDRLVAARLGNAGGVVIGLGEGETFVASDKASILQYACRACFLDDGEMAIVTAAGARYLRLDDGRAIQKEVKAMP
jgi:glucosamine--fructose-6-phosphate aminotransferase (isomerizing)